MPRGDATGTAKTCRNEDQARVFHTGFSFALFSETNVFLLPQCDLTRCCHNGLQIESVGRLFHGDDFEIKGSHLEGLSDLLVHGGQLLQLLLNGGLFCHFQCFL